MTTDSPIHRSSGFALYLETGLGPTIGPMMTHKLEMSINHRAGEILRHKVSRIIRSQDLSHLKLMEVLFFLDP